MILVTGATGLIGSHLILRLIQRKDDFIALKRNSSDTNKVKKIFSYYFDNYEELFSKIKWKNADILDYNELHSIVKDIDYVYHCAAIVSFEKKKKDIILKNNIEGTKNIVDLAIQHKVKKLCHVSSIAALGDKNDIITEKTIRANSEENSTYSKSKYLSELEVWRGIAEGLNAVIVNPSVVLGSGNWKNGSSSIFYKIHKGLNFYTEGITGFVDVRDVVEVMIKLQNSDITNQRFIINSNNISYKEIFTKIAHCLEKKPPKYQANKFLIDFAWRLDKMKSILPFQKHIFTKEIALSSLTKSYYSSEKLLKNIEHEFISFEKTLSDVSRNFITDIKSQNL